MGKAENQLSVNDLWRTPQWLLDVITGALGPVALDPCGHPDGLVDAELVVLAEQYRNVPTRYARVLYGDGLDLDWSGRGLVYANPPYSEYDRWAAKAAEADEIIYLAPVRSGNVWWQTYFGAPDGLVLLPRLTHAGAKVHAPFHQALVYFGPRWPALCAAFDYCGCYVRAVRPA